MDGVDRLDLLASMQYAAYSTAQVRQDGPKKADKKGAVKKSFLQSLLESRDAPAEEAIPGIAGLSDQDAVVVLKDALDKAGETLGSDRSNAAYGAYRKAVKHFVQFVVERNFVVEKSEVTRKVKKGPGEWVEEKNPRFLIKAIDEKLDKLAAEVLVNQGGNLQILAQIHEINGMVIDLMG
jgi:uncharacterized protein YaaR (DUF327 family)